MYLYPFNVIGCLASWCPCLAHARNRRRLQHLETTGTPDPDRDGLTGPDGWLYTFLEVACDMGWILQVSYQAISNRSMLLWGMSWSDYLVLFI